MSPNSVFPGSFILKANNDIEYSYFDIDNEKSILLKYSYDTMTGKWGVEELAGPDGEQYPEPEFFDTEILIIPVISSDEQKYYVMKHDYNNDGTEDTFCLSSSLLVIDLQPPPQYPGYKRSEISDMRDELAIHLAVIDGNSAEVLITRVIEPNYREDTKNADPRLLNSAGLMHCKIQNQDYVLVIFQGNPSACCVACNYRLYTMTDHVLQYAGVYDPWGERIEESYMMFNNFRKPIIKDFDQDGTDEIIFFSDGVGPNHF
ncbi:MAG: hypothetical protein JW969_02475 [Spirochaetales bacterium]|nr:hypothetical protein [Spirochaetales bacterium]